MQDDGVLTVNNSWLFTLHEPGRHDIFTRSSRTTIKSVVWSYLSSSLTMSNTLLELYKRIVHDAFDVPVQGVVWLFPLGPPKRFKYGDLEGCK